MIGEGVLACLRHRIFLKIHRIIIIIIIMIIIIFMFWYIYLLPIMFVEMTYLCRVETVDIIRCKKHRTLTADIGGVGGANRHH